MEQWIQLTLLIIQLCLFTLGRLLDDLTWYELHIAHQVQIFEGIGVGCMLTCIAIQIIRKRHIKGMGRILFVRSQLKFIISWALIVTIVVLFFNIFGCYHQQPQGQGEYFFMSYGSCWINVTLIMLSNFNFSLICNTKARKSELFVYEAILCAEVIFNAHLIILFIGSLQGQPKDESILLVSIIIANQVLIMDLIFRAAYEDREREQEKQQKLLHTFSRKSVSTRELNINNIEMMIGH